MLASHIYAGTIGASEKMGKQSTGLSFPTLSMLVVDKVVFGKYFKTILTLVQFNPSKF